MDVPVHFLFFSKSDEGKTETAALVLRWKITFSYCCRECSVDDKHRARRLASCRPTSECVDLFDLLPLRLKYFESKVEFRFVDTYTFVFRRSLLSLRRALRGELCLRWNAYPSVTRTLVDTDRVLSPMRIHKERLARRIQRRALCARQ